MFRTRSRTSHLIALGSSMLLTVTAIAAPPQINAINPFGAQRGVPSEITVSGSNLNGNPRLIAPFGFRNSENPAGADAAKCALKVIIDGETPIGVYPVRIQTDDGISNPFLLPVGQLPQVAEKEENNSFETAQAVVAPVVIEGQAAGNDVDYYKFAGKKGQRLVVDAQCARIGSGVDPSIRLTTVGHVFVASADDSPGLQTDARLVATLPEDTDYIVELSDSRYQGGGRPIYRLLVGEIPLAEEVYPIGGRGGETIGVELRGGSLNGLQTTAARLGPGGGVSLEPVRARGASAAFDVESLPAMIVGRNPEIRESADPAEGPVRAAAPVVLNGRIDPAGDEDRFTLAVTSGQRLRIEVEAAELGSALDGVLQILDAKGAQLAQADDTTPPPTKKAGAAPKASPVVSPDPTLEFTVPSGANEITLALRDLESRGGIGFPYRIVVTPTGPTFLLALNDSQISIPKGGSAVVGVTVERKGYAGPIALKVLNPPAGLTVRPGMIADGQTLGVLTVSASPDAAFQSVSLDVVGEAQSGEPQAVVKGVKSIVFAEQAAVPTNQVTQIGLVAAPALGLAASLEAPSEAIEVAHGYATSVQIKAIRGKDGSGVLNITGLNPPPGVTVAAAKIEEKAVEGAVSVTTTTDVPLGKMSVALLAKGKLGSAEQTLTAPVVTLSVVKPATVELTTAAIELKAGANLEMKGKVLRKGAFKEPITVKVNGLPAGLKADPVTVAPDASEFNLKIVADEKAAAATASANVALAFQVNKKDYPSPTTPLAVKVLPAK